MLIGDWEPESQFEGIAYVPENATFLLLHEARALRMLGGAPACVGGAARGPAPAPSAMRPLAPSPPCPPPTARQALEHEGRAPTYKPFIREVKIQSDMGGYDTLSVCEVDYEFDEENKGGGTLLLDG